MLGFFKRFSLQNAKPSHTSDEVSEAASSTATHTFRGGMSEFMNTFYKLSEITRVEICGEYLSEGTSAYSEEPELLDTIEFMRIIDKKEIKELSFKDCRLNRFHGMALADELKTNRFLEKLEVNSSHLTDVGMRDLLTGLKENKSLRVLHSCSYNVENYYWSHSNLQLLADLVSIHPTLERVELPDNQLTDFSDIVILLTPYTTIKGRTLASITGLAVSRVPIPVFCNENADNGSLEQASSARFMPHG